MSTSRDRVTPLADTLSFPTDRTLLHPKFESYKLSLPSIGSSSFPLPSSPFKYQPLLNDDAQVRLSFSQVQSRARHNHLVTSPNGELVWIERDLKITAVRFDNKTAKPTFHKVFQLPTPSTSSSSSSSSSYPVILTVSKTRWLISDGTSSNLYLLSIDPETLTGKLFQKFKISLDQDQDEPVLLHRADIVSSEEMMVLLSVTKKVSNKEKEKEKEENPPILQGGGGGGAIPQSRLKLTSKTHFEYFSIRLPLLQDSEPNPDDQILKEVKPEWKVKNHDLPFHTGFDQSLSRYYLLSSDPITRISSISTTPPTELPTTEIDQEMTLSEGTSPSELPSHSSSTSQIPPPPKPAPFSWTQDSSSLTVAFPIPSSTPTSSIRITISRQFLTLHIASPKTSLASKELPGGMILPKISHKKWWGEIDPHTSVWTFDRESQGRDSDSEFGILTLHLEKQHSGTKWSDVFLTTKPRQDEESDKKIVEMKEEWEYEEVLETLDPSELLRVSEEMEKWTKNLIQTGDLSQSNEGLGHGVPTSLMGDEMDVEIDSLESNGKKFIISWIEPQSQESEVPRIVTPHSTIPYSLLSTPLPISSSSSSSNKFDSSITIKHDVDGLLFSPPPPPTPPSSSSYQWLHESTFPALAFVLATKRETKFVFHHRDQFVLAFDSPPLYTTTTSEKTSGGGGNVFVYFSPKGKEKMGKQMVLKIGGNSNSCGQVLGVAGIELDGGDKVGIVVLCERELVVLRLE